MDKFQAQYFQLVDPAGFCFPENIVDPLVQESIFTNMFNGPALPPASYQTRALKKILSQIEQSIAGPDDEIIEPLLTTFTDLLGRRKPSAFELAQELAYVTYTVPASTAASTRIDRGNRTVTTIESKSLLLSSGTTGLRTWEAALHLGTYLCTRTGEDLLRGKRVVELGAGTGFLSLLCARWLPVEKIVATDCDKRLTGNIDRCIQLNGMGGTRKIVSGIWKWGEPLSLSLEGERDKGLDIALGADLIYDTDLIPLLLSTLRDLFDNYQLKVFIISATLRNEKTFDAFLRACESDRLAIECIPFEVPPESEQSSFFHSIAVPIKMYKIQETTASDFPTM